MNIFQQRVNKLIKLLTENACDGLIVEDTINLYYLTGLNLSAGRLVVHSSGAHLIVDSRYFEMCKKNSAFPAILSDVGLPLNQLFSLPELNSLQCLAFSSDNVTYGGFLQLEKAVNAFNEETGKKLTLKAVEGLLGRLRMIKDPSEIDTLREAAKLGSEGFDFLCSILKEGVAEAELAVELEIFWKRRGGKTLSFDPIIAFGSNSSMPHYRVGNKKLRKGKSVLIDIGVNYENYHSDMTRVVYFGEPDPKILAIHQIVLQAQQRALDLCKPGTLIGELDVAARTFIAEQGYGENFMHGLGHGVGLEIHEAPTIRNKPPYSQMPLQEGMVITIEPGIYLPGIGGVRIEDTVVITPKGYENLTNRPKEPLIIKKHG